jgi:hypothetical protein
MARSEGRFLSEMRRSNSSGLHGKRSSDRFNVNRKIIDWEVAMSVTDEVLPHEVDTMSLYDMAEPTNEDLLAIEEELDFDEEDGYNPFDDPDNYDPWYSPIIKEGDVW